MADNKHTCKKLNKVESTRFVDGKRTKVTMWFCLCGKEVK